MRVQFRIILTYKQICYFIEILLLLEKLAANMYVIPLIFSSCCLVEDPISPSIFPANLISSTGSSYIFIYLVHRYTGQVYGDKLSEVLDKKKKTSNDVHDDDDDGESKI